MNEEELNDMEVIKDLNYTTDILKRDTEDLAYEVTHFKKLTTVYLGEIIERLKKLEAKNE